ncbi:glycosyltransferase [Brevibacillus gelatini]
MGKISLAMIVRNEQNSLSKCLLSVREYVDEMIVIDTGSTDDTKKIANECGAEVYDYPWTNSFAEARNYSLQKVTGDWILVLDADEHLDQETAYLIREFAAGPPAIGRVMIFSKYLDDREICITRSPISRLFPRGVRYKGNIHEQVVSDLPHRLTGINVIHEGYVQTDKTGRNLSLLDQELKKDPHNPYLLMQTAREFRNRQDFLTAHQFYSKAYKGTTGQEGYFPNLVVEYIYNLMKIGELNEGHKVILAEQNKLSKYPDYHFATGMFYMDYIQANVNNHLDKLASIEASFLRCLEIGDQNDQGGVVGTGSFLAAFNLGVYYEVMGSFEKALKYYQISSEQGYLKATERLQLIKNR